MKLNQEELDNIQKIRNLSGENEERVIKVLEALFELTLQDYSENERIQIPFFGSLMIKYKGEIISNRRGKEADIDVFFNPSDNLRLNIGKIEDLKKNLITFTEIPIIEEKLKQTEVILKSKLTDSHSEVKKYLE